MTALSAPDPKCHEAVTYAPFIPKFFILIPSIDDKALPKKCAHVTLKPSFGTLDTRWMNSVIKVLFVCTGNICRSPTADGIFRKLVRDAGLESHIHVDSCGLSAYHVGELPDPRSRKMAQSRGIDLTDIRSRKIRPDDFQEFDYVLAMDDGHLQDMRRQAPDQYHDRIELFLDYHPTMAGQSVPDPYYGGTNGFVTVFDMIEEASLNLLSQIRKKHGL